MQTCVITYLLLGHFFSLSFVQTLVVDRCNSCHTENSDWNGFSKALKAHWNRRRPRWKRRGKWENLKKDALLWRSHTIGPKTARDVSYWKYGGRESRRLMRHSNPHKFPTARRIRNIEPVANCYSQWFQQIRIRRSRKCKTFKNWLCWYKGQVQENSLGPGDQILVKQRN